MMFPEIDNIDWEAFGEEEMPNLLLSLLSDDKNIRGSASISILRDLVPHEVIEGTCKKGELEEHIARDGLILMIKPLIAFLRYEHTPSKASILEILMEMLGYIGIEKDYLAEVKWVWYRAFTCQIYNQINRGKKVYLQLKNDDEKNVRDFATELLEILTDLQNPCK